MLGSGDGGPECDRGLLDVQVAVTEVKRTYPTASLEMLNSPTLKVSCFLVCLEILRSAGNTCSRNHRTCQSNCFAKIVTQSRDRGGRGSMPVSSSRERDCLLNGERAVKNTHSAVSSIHRTTSEVSFWTYYISS